MMTAEYRFVCGSCKYECISGIGTEKGPHYSMAAMVCEVCRGVGSFALPNPGGMHGPSPESMICKKCQSSENLTLWDAMTCPQCKMKMKALGANIKAIRPYKYW
jgi:RecJ-like exonuclease